MISQDSGGPDSTLADVGVSDSEARTDASSDAGAADAGALWWDSCRAGDFKRIAQGPADSVAISGNGRVIVFVSDGAHHVPNDGNGVMDVFAYDQTTESTVVVSADGSGAVLAGQSTSPSVDHEGRWVAFASHAPLDAQDGNQLSDIYLRDLSSQAVERANLTNAGTEFMLGGSYSPDISPNGRYVAFVSDAADAHAMDGDAVADVFVRDLFVGETHLASTSSSGLKANADCLAPSITDQVEIAFISLASNLEMATPGQAYVKTITTGELEVVSMGTSGAGNAASNFPRISASGRFVVFVSFASDLIDDDANGLPDVFLRDRFDATTTRAAGRNEPNGISSRPDVTESSLVVFESTASNLVSGDTGAVDVFLFSKERGSVDRVTGDYQGPNPDFEPLQPRLSSDGCFAAFTTRAQGMDATDLDAERDVYVACLCER